ncbi:MAG: hypothetical protein C4542_04970 [Dehalococcoidia bacterium]|nr:MAG: hypothetical protein C4542_04970 [Dehalococcoidia bacterium]
MSIKAWWAEHFSDKPSSSRWGIIQIILTVSLWLVATAVSFYALYISFATMGLWMMATVVFILACLAFVFGILLGCVSIYLAFNYLAKGTKDNTATKDDIGKLTKTIKSLTKEVHNGFANQQKTQRHSKAEKDGNGRTDNH